MIDSTNMAKLRGHHIICFAPSDWWGMNPSCTTHIMKRLADKNRILYVNPFSSDLFGEKRGIFKRFPRKIKSTLKWLRCPQANMYVFSPLFLPLQGKEIIDSINNTLLRTQMKLVCQVIGIKHPILWVENLRAADLIEWFEHTLVVYHVSDLFTDCRYTSNKAVLKSREKKILDKSDVLICVSKELYAQKSKEHRNVHYLPHGVDFSLFARPSTREICFLS